MFCPKCGKEVREGLKFCTVCGAALVQAGHQTAESGKSFVRSENLVSRSGKVVAEPKELGERKKYIALIAVLLVIIIAAGAASVLLLRKQREFRTEIATTEDDTNFDWDEEEDFESSDEGGDVFDEGMDGENEESETGDSLAFDGLDVEQEVLRIREIYNMMQSDYSNYDASQMDWGKKYSNGTYTKCIVNAGYDGVEQERWYFYENDELIFSFYYAGANENRFYFYNGRMFRWIDAEKNIHDLETDSAEFQSREDAVLRESGMIMGDSVGGNDYSEDSGAGVVFE